MTALGNRAATQLLLRIDESGWVMQQLRRGPVCVIKHNHFAISRSVGTLYTSLAAGDAQSSRFSLSFSFVAPPSRSSSQGHGLHTAPGQIKHSLLVSSSESCCQQRLVYASAMRREEPGPGQESVWDYPRPPRLEPVPERITVELGGKVRYASTCCFAQALSLCMLCLPMLVHFDQ